MNKLIGTVACVVWILGLFYLDRDRKARTSKALWVPVTWLLIIGSRSISSWLQMRHAMSSVAQFEEGTPVDAAVYGLLIISSLLILNRRASRVREILRDNLPLVLFFAYCALSVVWSEFPLIVCKRWIKGLGDCAIVCVVLTDLDPMAATRKLFKWTAFLLLPLSVLFILCYPELGTSYDAGSRVTYYSGVTLGKNELGMTCLVCGLGSLWSLLGVIEDRALQRRTGHAVAHFGTLGTAISLIVRADSMTSLACFVIAGTVMVVTTQRWVAKQANALNIVVLGSVGLALFAVFLDTAGALVRSLGRNSTLTGRTGIWAAVLSLHTNPLIGTGLESFWLGSRLQAIWDATHMQGIQEAHNGYLEVYLNLGWIGEILLGAVIVTGYLNVLAICRNDSHAGRLRLALFTTSMIYNLTEAGFRIMSPVWVAFLLAVTVTSRGVRLMPIAGEPESHLSPLIGRSRVRILR